MSVISDVADLVRHRYVLADRAEHAADALLGRAAAGVYRGLSDAALADRLTEDLFDLCADHHLRVRVRAPAVRRATSEDDWRAARRARQSTTGFGIAKVERFDDGVGLLDLREIAEPSVGGRAVAAAMELVSHTGALIVDLRHCIGGSPHGVAMWCSYLFPDERTHLNDVHDRPSGVTRQFWTWPYLPGERYLDRPVWLLTSATTFSGGEEMAYDLQVLRRATLIGTTTRGGAHPTTTVPLTDGLELAVPTARSVNPVTGTNWEGTGVVPDVAVDPATALDVAHRAASDHVLTSAGRLERPRS